MTQQLLNYKLLRATTREGISEYDEFKKERKGCCTKGGLDRSQDGIPELEAERVQAFVEVGARVHAGTGRHEVVGHGGVEIVCRHRGATGDLALHQLRRE